MEKLNGRIALVTGALGGLGSAIAERLVVCGATVVRCDLVEADSAPESLTPYRQLDVSSEQHWQELVSEIAETYGGLDILVNNAGINRRLGIMQSDLREWQETFAVNFFGAVLGVRACVPIMKDRPSPSIVNINSTSGLVGHPDAAYSSSKWALRGLARTAALEFADLGIRVNSVHPGSVPTELHSNTQPGHADTWRKLIPMARAGRADEIAAMVSFLVSDACSYVTGAEFPVDGGLSGVGLLTARKRLMAEFSETALQEGGDPPDAETR